MEEELIIAQQCKRCHVFRQEDYFVDDKGTYVNCSICREQRRGYWHGVRTGNTKVIVHTNIEGQPAKACTQCKKVKTLDNYSKAQGKSSDNLKAVCKACIKLEAQTEEGKKKQAVRAKRYYDKNSKIINQKGKEWRQKNIERRKKYVKEYQKRKYATDPNYRLKCCLRSQMYRTLTDQDAIKSRNTIKLIGCSVEELMNYLESLFEEGMSWENYGEWHIDHIKPCAKFKLQEESEQRKCFHYSNLQPLWAHDNMSKGDKWTDEDETKWLMFHKEE